MSGIAELLINQGFEVSGSDLKNSVIINKLEKNGAKINIAFTDANTTTTMRVRLAAAVSGNGDSSIVTNQVSGDLA